MEKIAPIIIEESRIWNSISGELKNPKTLRTWKKPTSGWKMILLRKLRKRARQEGKRAKLRYDPLIVDRKRYGSLGEMLSESGSEKRKTTTWNT